ncbi:hypothetical protein [Desulfoscipio geothermicus]|uniref:BhlA holin family protein n=1 Tax=Desulfoscipio geothermicus DSM 3669 TaxID=1121426 RepID=A0A1I6DWQ9_9FIRM|nr:hypothetical protein [Desulfoscipio geothermicus]SFR09752.1 hypothetical protein SAMN05660706_11950 [Desulfoscipio geothermicus DSM 3669]
MEFNATLLAQLLNVLVLLLIIFLIYRLVKAWINNHYNATLQRKEIIKKLDNIEAKFNEILVLIKEFLRKV